MPFYYDVNSIFPFAMGLDTVIKLIQSGDKRWTVDAKFSGASAIVVKISRGKHSFILIPIGFL